MVTSKKFFAPDPVIIDAPVNVVDEVPLPAFNVPVPEILPAIIYEILAAGVIVPVTLISPKVFGVEPLIAEAAPAKTTVPPRLESNVHVQIISSFMVRSPAAV